MTTNLCRSFSMARHKQQGKSMVTRTYHIQHHIQMDIRCMKQGSRLSILISQSSQHFRSHQHSHQHGCCICTRWTCDSHLQQKKSSMDTLLPADILSPSQQDTAKVNAPLPLMERPKRNFTTNAENRSVLYTYLQMVAQWQSTSP